VVAYELLYRTPGTVEAVVQDPIQATARVVIGAALDIGLTRLVGNRPAWINFSAEMLVSWSQPPLHPERMVIEVLEGGELTEELLQSLRRLRESGYRIALDDYDIRTESEQLLQYADYVKVDVRNHTRAELADSVRALRRHRFWLVAEKIETPEELAHCRSLGFDLFQGYFLGKPKTVQVQRTPEPRLTILELIVRLTGEDITAEEIEKLIQRDVGLSYRILRCINSSFFQVPRQISSIREAILLLGLDELRKLCWLILLAGLDGQPVYVCIESLLRARMCEDLCKRAGRQGSESYFMTGMLSRLDVFLGVPMSAAIDMLPLHDAVVGALLRREGDLGAALRCAENFERGSWSDLRFADLGPAEISAAYLQAAEWADRTWQGFRRGG
jgi:EAL and modified HD-GYP domain-containing signal transduction protein